MAQIALFGRSDEPPNASPVIASEAANTAWATLSNHLEALAAARHNSPSKRIPVQQEIGKKYLGKNISDGKGKPYISTDFQFEQVIVQANEFVRLFPDDPRCYAAKKAELWSLLHLQKLNRKKITEFDEVKITRFIKDPNVSAKDRYEISALQKQVRISSLGIKKADELRKLNMKCAKELIQEFPDDMRGYGFFMTIAANFSAEQAIKASTEILAGIVSEKNRKPLIRLIEQKKLEGTRLRVDGLDLDAHKGATTVLYTWTIKRPEALQVIKRYNNAAKVRFIGINIDPDITSAKIASSRLQLPGIQYFDAGGMYGPLASQLFLQTPVSLYIIDGNSVLIDTRGHINLGVKLAMLLNTSKKDNNINSTIENGEGE